MDEKNRKNIKKLINQRAKELKTFYKSADADKIQTYNAMIEHLAFIDVMLKVFQDNILEDGYLVEYQNGKNQWGKKKNESVDLFKKWYSDRLSDSEKLENLLKIETDESTDELDEFINRRKNKIL